MRAGRGSMIAVLSGGNGCMRGGGVRWGEEGDGRGRARGKGGGRVRMRASEVVGNGKIE